MGLPGSTRVTRPCGCSWPTYENKAGFPSTEPMSDMIHAMSGHVHVNLAVQDADDEAAARSLLTASGVPLDHVHFFHIEHGDIWARDMGPQFTRSRSGRLRINDWNFNCGGTKSPTASEHVRRALRPHRRLRHQRAGARRAGGVP